MKQMRCVPRTVRLLRSLVSAVVSFSVLTSVGCGVIASPTTVTPPAVTNLHGDTVMEAFKATFYVDDGNGAGHFSAMPASLSPKPESFWNQAEQIESVEDAAERNSTFTPLVVSLLNGFTLQYGNDWTTATAYNDDMMWATLAFVRGYDLTKNTSYLNLAKSNFDAAYSRGLDPADGGLWWNTSDNVKNPAIEGSASLAAALLASRLADPTYQAKSLSILQFEMSAFLNPTNGAVASTTGGKVFTSYVQGTFLEASELNGYTSQAAAAANFLMTMGTATSSSGGYNILPSYQGTKNNWGYNSIAIRWVYKYMTAAGLQNTYLPWLNANATAAYSVRNGDNNSWDDWFDPTPASSMLESWMCVSGLTAAQLPNQ